MKVTASLNSCSRLHPGIASNVHMTTFTMAKTGRSVTRPYCSACRAACARSLNTAGHGLMPLAWKPPERVLNSYRLIDSEPASFGRLLARMMLRDALRGLTVGMTS